MPYNLDDLFPLNRAPQSFARLTAKSQAACVCDDEPYSVQFIREREIDALLKTTLGLAFMAGIVRLSWSI